MMLWIAIILAGAGSFAFRFTLAAVVDRVQLPSWTARVTGYVMPAAFAALAASALVGSASGGAGVLPPLAGVAVTGLVATRATAPVAMACGLPTVWVAVALNGVLS